jgi:hypothetical protein
MEVDIDWAEGRATRARLRPRFTGVQTLRPPRGQTIAQAECGGRDLSLRLQPDGTARLEMTAGRECVISFR